MFSYRLSLGEDLLGIPRVCLEECLNNARSAKRYYLVYKGCMEYMLDSRKCSGLTSAFIDMCSSKIYRQHKVGERLSKMLSPASTILDIGFGILNILIVDDVLRMRLGIAYYGIDITPDMIREVLDYLSQRYRDSLVEYIASSMFIISCANFLTKPLPRNRV